jgi:hypothetical protein
MTPKIIELIIQEGDEQAGLDGIALVELPAHEAKFEYFKDDVKPVKYVLADNEIGPAIKMFSSYGEPQGLLESEGWKIVSVTPTNRQDFQSITSEPNKDSPIFDTPNTRVRFKYVGPITENSRDFCRDMMSLRRVFRIEDIDQMSREDVNSVGPNGYDIFEWRGSYNCQHGWVKLVYAKEGTIINNDKVKKGVLYEENVGGPDTRTDATIAAGNTPPRDFFSSCGCNDFNNPNTSTLAPYVDQVTKKVVKKPVLASLPMFDNKEDAEALALTMGCEGSHEMVYGDKTLYMPCKQESEDCPPETKDVKLNLSNRQKAIDEANYGPQNPNEPNNDYWKAKANMFQGDVKDAKKALCGNCSFFNQTKKILDCIAEGIGGEDAYDTIEAGDLGLCEAFDFKCASARTCDAWVSGGPIVDGFQDDLEDACWEGYEPIGLKDKDGKMVPNCVPIKENNSKTEFESYNDYPEAAKNNACKVLKWRDEYGDDVKGMTQIGWTRANQLCKGENISEETIARMSSFQRHKKNSEVSPELKTTPWKDAGYVAWLGWGGTTGINWASDKLNSIRNEMSFSVFNSEERIVVGPAMIPEKMIIRRNEITGEIYYVFFTAKTIKQLQQKYMQEKLLDKTNIEHGRKFIEDVDVVESWIVEDENYDKQKVFNMNYPVGTWMIMMKVNNDDAWNKVKDGKLKGFSVQGYFMEKAMFNSEKNNILSEIKEILKDLR